MTRAIADTHALVWAYFGDSRLSPAARAEFSAGLIGVSTISLAEIVYLEEKGRLPSGTREGLRAMLADPNVALEEVPVAMPIVDAMARIARAEVPDLPDRLIAATALSVGVPLITRDRKIRATSLETIW